MGFFQKNKDNDKIYRTGYQSGIDIFLKTFDNNRPLTGSRLKEVQKFQALFAKRDGLVDEPENYIWKKF